VHKDFTYLEQKQHQSRDKLHNHLSDNEDIRVEHPPRKCFLKRMFILHNSYFSQN
jgi:hypothetical protein